MKDRIQKGKQQAARLRVEASTLRPRLRKDETPERAFQGLFHDIQTNQLHPDSKAFVDAVPLAKRRAILKSYEEQRTLPEFDLMAFVATHFRVAPTIEAAAEIDTNHSMSEHISLLWDGLKRQTLRRDGSLLEVPHSYVVPGGRFNELFYWDSYFIMMGLVADGRVDEAEGILRNFAYMLRRYGYIPTANRSYLTSRSQPPFFSHMVRMLATYKGQRLLVRYLPYLVMEYRFWMKGARSLKKDGPVANRRAVLMPNGSILNRYYDDESAPRPESYPEDLETAEQAVERQAGQVYLDVRAAAESGWDFSSRWLRDSRSLSTIHTTDLVPVDLNSLLYQLEMCISDIYRRMKQKRLSEQFADAAEQRASAMRQYCWDEKEGFFYDYDIVTGAHSGRETLAGVFPLYAGVATKEQAARVAERLQKNFLKAGGLLTTTMHTAQQWDAPNGWAPLQMVSIYGLRRYDFDALAEEIRDRWLACNQRIFDERHKMVEKYNVVHPGAVAGGGEYALQDGFGWTNGVAQALIKEDAKLRKALSDV